MATTILDTFEGEPTIDVEKAKVIYEWYAGAQGDEDKCTDTEDNAFYEGQRMAYQAVLALLYNDHRGEWDDNDTRIVVREDMSTDYGPDGRGE